MNQSNSYSKWDIEIVLNVKNFYKEEIRKLVFPEIQNLEKGLLPKILFWSKLSNPKFYYTKKLLGLNFSRDPFYEKYSTSDF